MEGSFALDFSIDGLAAEESSPAPDRLIAGAPRFRT